MIEPTLAVQKLIFTRLNDAAIVPAGHLFDKGGRPERFPCINIGAASVAYPDYYGSFSTDVATDIHCWTDEADLASVKTIAAQVREALWRGPWSIDGHRCANLRIEQGRFIRDPDGIHSHAVISVTAILQEEVQPR